MTVQVHEEPRCQECGSSLTEHAGFLVCNECGVTDSRHISSTPYEHDRSLAKVLGSNIGYSNSTRRDRFYNLRREQVRTRFRSWLFTQALERLEQVSRQLNFTTSCEERSKALVKRARSKGWKESYAVLSAACMIIAAHEEGLPISDREILDTWKNHDKNASNRYVRKAQVWLQDNLGVTKPLKTPLHYLPRMISALQTSPMVSQSLEEHNVDNHGFFYELTRQTRALLEDSSCLDYGGSSPIALAASAVYVIGKTILLIQDIWTQKDIADACGIPAFTIRHHMAMWKEVLSRQRQH